MNVRDPGEEPVGPSPRAGVDRLLPGPPETLSRETGEARNRIGLRLIGKETPEPTTVNLVSVIYEWHGHTIEIEVVD